MPRFVAPLAVNTTMFEAWMVPIVASGGLACWIVPVLARSFPSRSASDAAMVAAWPVPLRLALAAAGVTVVASAIMWTTEPASLSLTIALGLVLVTSASVDLRTSRLPDRLTILAASTFACIAGISVLGKGVDVLMRVAVGAGLFAGILYVVHRLHPTGMGRGDVKLAAVLGAMTGVATQSSAMTVNLVVASLLAAIVVTLLASLAVGLWRRTWVAAVPFGPGLVAASWVVATTSG